MLYVSRSTLAQQAASRWKSQYFTGDRWNDSFTFHKPKESRKSTYNRLVALGETPRPDAVDEVIGNGSWTTIACDACGVTADRAIIVADTTKVCGMCLRMALRLIENHGSPDVTNPLKKG